MTAGIKKKSMKEMEHEFRAELTIQFEVKIRKELIDEMETQMDAAKSVLTGILFKKT